MCSNYVENLKGAKVRRTVQDANPQTGVTMKALTDREGK
jgi:hypothetical protein